MTGDKFITEMESLLARAKEEGYVFAFESHYDDRIREWITVYSDEKEFDFDVLYDPDIKKK